MATITELEEQARIHAKARAELESCVMLLKIEMDAIKRKRMAKLKNAIAAATESGVTLLALVQESPELFRKPKSALLHGIKLGFKKEKGKLEIIDPDKTITLIRKHFPELADVLIATKESPSKEGLNACDAATLKKVGVTVTSDTDVAFITDPSSEIDKLVSALLKGAEEEVTA